MHQVASISLLALFVPGTHALAQLQCQPEFQHVPVQDFTGVQNAVISDIDVWDPDGVGPAGEILVVSGSFDSIDASTDRNLAFMDLATGAWVQPIPSLPGAFGLAVGTGPGGRIAATAFPNGGQANLSEIFEWDGSAWQKLPPLAADLQGSPTTLKYDSQGLLYCLGFIDASALTTRVGVWDGSQWQLLGGGLSSSAVDLQIASDDSVYVSAAEGVGDPTGASNALSRWNGSFWEAAFVGTQVIADRVEGFVFLSDGRLAAGGLFDDGSGAGKRRWAIWNGTDWEVPPNTPLSPMGSSVARALELPTGEVLFAAAMPSDSGELSELFVKWDGVSLQPFASIAQGSVGGLNQVLVDGQGTVWAGGSWDLSSTPLVESGLSRAVSPCAATANPLGIAGQGSAGAVQLTAQNLPWLGGTFRASVDGLAPLAVPFTLIGAQLGAQPLSNLSPLADAGSFLYLQPNLALTEVLTQQQGAAQFETSLPSDASLTGLLIGLQVASLELDSLGQPVSIATSNALALTFGSY